MTLLFVLDYVVGVPLSKRFIGIDRDGRAVVVQLGLHLCKECNWVKMVKD